MNGKCTCANGFVLSQDGSACECAGYLKDDGQTCATNCGSGYWTIDGNKCVCPDGFTLSQDGWTCGCTGYLTENDTRCVEFCESWKFEEDESTKERRCVADCKAWYWTVQNGRCTEEKWRLNTAIAVPIVIVLAAGSVGVAYFFWKKKGGARKIENIDSL